ncbi:MAG: hypothetical protein V8R83_09910 [Candidatus Gastranaerophilaceae bacterium]
MTINAQQVLDQIKEIPAMPNVIVKALGIIKDDQSGTKELSEIMAYDQALTSLGTQTCEFGLLRICTRDYFC